MKLKYFYCTHELGILEKVEDGYRYTSNVSNEQMMLQRRLYFRCEYDLWDSNKRTSEELFPAFQKIVADANREDIVKRAGITPDDSDWEKLVKLSKLKYFPSGFYVQFSEE